MHDIMLHRPSSSPEDDPATSFLIDHDATATASLRTYLKRHKLRSKLKIGSGPESDGVVAAAWRNPLDSGEGQSTDREVQAAEEWLEERKKAWDPRVVGMGRRWVEPKDGEKREYFLDGSLDRPSASVPAGLGLTVLKDRHRHPLLQRRRSSLTRSHQSTTTFTGWSTPYPKVPQTFRPCHSRPTSTL